MKLFQSTKIQFATLFLIVVSTFTVKAIGEPLVLSNAQLDTVSAGYVNLYGNAQANAVGAIALADIIVDTAQVQTQSENGVTYTVSSVFARATAVGEQVDTAVSVGFETNENIVSLEVQHSSVSEIAPVNRAYPVRRNNHGGYSSDSESHKERRNAGRFQRRHHRHHRQRGNGRYNHATPVIYQNETVRLTLITLQNPH